MFFKLREDKRANISLSSEFVMNLAEKVGSGRDAFFAEGFLLWNKGFLHIWFGYGGPKSPLESL